MKRFYINYFATIFCLLTFAISLSLNIIPLAIIGCIAFAGCLVWFAKLAEKDEKWSYKQIRRHSDKLNGIEKELKIMQFEIRGKADAKVDINKGNVRPGSKASITYQDFLKISQEAKNDVRAEAEEAESK